MNKHPVQALEEILRNPTNIKGALSNTSALSNVAIGDAIPNLSTTTSPGEYGSTVSGPASPGTSVVNYALAQVGKPYKWGSPARSSSTDLANVPAFDCSGLVWAAYASIGVSVPTWTGGFLTTGKHVTKANLQPGDVVIPEPTHVQIYIGNGQVVEAPHSGANVRVVDMWGFIGGRRYV